MFAALGLVENAGQALGITAAGLLTAPLGLMSLLNAQGTLYLLTGALVVILGRKARPSGARRRKEGTTDGLAVGEESLRSLT